MEFVELGNYVNIITKGTTPTSLGKNFVENGIKFLRAQNVINGKVLLNDDILFIDGSTHNKELKRSQIQEGDVLLTIAGTIGRTAIVKNINEPLNCNQAVALIRLGKSDIDKDYLCKYLSSNSAQNQYNRGKVSATISNLSLTQIRKLKIPLPKLEIQKKIAAILDEADKIRTLNKELIIKYDALTQSLFLEMFGNPFAGENIEPLKENVKIIGGYAFKSKDFVKDGIPLIKIGTVNKGYFEIDNFSFLPKEFLEKYSKWIVRPNDILMSLTGTVGKNDYGNVEVSDSTFLEYFLNQRVAKLEPNNEKYLKGFLLGLFSNLKTKTMLTKISRGVRQANISNRDIENLQMIVPPLKMQKKYIDSIELIKNQKQQVQVAAQKSEDLFNSLLQKAFKGELVKE
tara:strand:- start:9195 stop:10394 length:1200 start_codon:yes stop_codon:yes gene_type:complete